MNNLATTVLIPEIHDDYGFMLRNYQRAYIQQNYLVPGMFGGQMGVTYVHCYYVPLVWKLNGPYLSLSHASTCVHRTMMR